MIRRITLLVTLPALLVGVVPSDSSAQTGVSCSISASGVAFGSYDVLSPSPTDSTGTVTYQCTAGVFVRVELGPGSSSSFAARTLRSGGETMKYNLYLDAGHSTVWGDGSGGSNVYSTMLMVLDPVSVMVYGRVPARQDAAAGVYNDSILATIVF